MTKTLIGTLHILHANTFLTRLIGLIGKKQLAKNTALLITPCRSVHTIGMRFDICLICLDKNGIVVQVVERLPPNRFFFGRRNVYQILEFSLATQGINNHLIGKSFYQKGQQ